MSSERYEPTPIELWAAWAWANVPYREYDEFLRTKAAGATKMTAADIGLDAAPHWLFEQNL